MNEAAIEINRYHGGTREGKFFIAVSPLGGGWYLGSVFCYHKTNIDGWQRNEPIDVSISLKEFHGKTREKAFEESCKWIKSIFGDEIPINPIDAGKTWTEQAKE